METKKFLTILVMILGLLVCLPKAGNSETMGTAFTYQGRLIDANESADGLYDFQFKLFDSAGGAGQVGGDVDMPDIDVTDGYFTVKLDFGSVFDGNERWLEIGVRPGNMNDPNGYTALIPRQEITATPYTIYSKASKTEIVVAAYNSLSSMKDQADYICDGIADDVEIQAAIDLVSDSCKKGTVMLLPGSYYCSTNVALKNQVSVRGTAALQNTFITWESGTNCDGFTFTTSNSSTRGAFKIENLTLLNHNNGDYWCIYIDDDGDALYDSDFINVYTQGGGGGASWSGGGLYIGNSWSVKIERCWFEHSKGTGLCIDGGTVIINDTLCAHNAAYGARLKGSYYCSGLRCGNNSGGLMALDDDETLSGTFEVGETVSQAMSGAGGTIVDINGSDATYTPYIAPGTNKNIFDSSHVITGITSGATMTPSSISYNDYPGLCGKSISGRFVNCSVYENYSTGLRIMGSSTESVLISNSQFTGNNRQLRASNEYGAGVSLSSEVEDVIVTNCISNGYSYNSGSTAQRMGFYNEASNCYFINCLAKNNVYGVGVKDGSTSDFYCDVFMTDNTCGDYYSDVSNEVSFSGAGDGSAISHKLKAISVSSSTYSVSQNDNGAVYGVNCASSVHIDLPRAVAGLEYTFVVTDATCAMQLDPYGSENIRLADHFATSADGDYITNDTAKAIGDSVRVKCLVDGVWEHFDSIGTWTEE